MLYGTNVALTKHNFDEVVSNALLESFAVHARSLMAFLWDNPSERHRRRYPNEIWAVDYFDADAWIGIRRPAESTLGDVRRRVGSEIAHLSLARTNQPDARVWEHEHIAFSIGRSFRLFLQHVDTALLIDNFEADLRSAWPRELNFPIAISWPSTTDPLTAATSANLAGR